MAAPKVQQTCAAPPGSAALPDLLAALRDVRGGLRERPRGHRADRPIAKDLGLSKVTLILGASVLSVALVVDSVMNGAARPFFGWVSDNIGRENTMMIAFTLGGLSYLSLGYFGTSPWLFVICAALIFFTWGEIFSLFPSTCTDLFGNKYATTNAMLLYTAKGTSAWLYARQYVEGSSGSWNNVFLMAAAVNFAVVVAAWLILKPARKRMA